MCPAARPRRRLRHIGDAASIERADWLDVPAVGHGVPDVAGRVRRRDPERVPSDSEPRIGLGAPARVGVTPSSPHVKLTGPSSAVNANVAVVLVLGLPGLLVIVVVGGVVSIVHV